MNSKTQFIKIRYNKKQTHDSLIANWIAVFEYSKTHLSNPLALNGYPHSKSPYNALQTLEHWVRHVCVRIVSLLFDFATKNLHLATIFYHLVAKWQLNNFFSSATNSNWFRESYLFKFFFIIICEERKQKVLILNVSENFIIFFSKYSSRAFQYGKF